MGEDFDGLIVSVTKFGIFVEPAAPAPVGSPELWPGLRAWAEDERVMTATTMLDVPVSVGAGGRTPFSWSAAIAGAFAATAVTLIIVALGSGIGLSLSSPYSAKPSNTALTAAAAVWLVMAQAMGFATGGYLAGRLRSPALDGVPGETRFRDAAEGLVVWAIGVVAMATLAALTGFFAWAGGSQMGGMARQFGGSW